MSHHNFKFRSKRIRSKSGLHQFSAYGKGYTDTLTRAALARNLIVTCHQIIACDLFRSLLLLLLLLRLGWLLWAPLAQCVYIQYMVQVIGSTVALIHIAQTNVRTQLTFNLPTCWLHFVLFNHDVRLDIRNGQKISCMVVMTRRRVEKTNSTHSTESQPSPTEEENVCNEIPMILDDKFVIAPAKMWTPFAVYYGCCHSLDRHWAIVADISLLGQHFFTFFAVFFGGDTDPADVRDCFSLGGCCNVGKVIILRSGFFYGLG